MQKWQIFAKDFAKKWIEYSFLAMTANANVTANAQCERTLSASEMSQSRVNVNLSQYVLLLLYRINNA